MKIQKIAVRNFRRLESVSASIEDRETVFVGPNNSGKTSATSIFQYFLGKRKFKIFDFSVSKISDIDTFGVDGNSAVLPTIELDIWFQVDPESIEFGRAFTLLPNLSDNFEKLGIRLKFGVSDPQGLLEAYQSAYPAEGEDGPAKPISSFLSQDANISKYFSVSYCTLEDVEDEISATDLEQSEGKTLLQSLVRIDFVDAQRNIDDDEGHRANKLSNAFAGFYQNNLEQADAAAEAQQAIDENNARLTEHYATQFGDLMTIIQDLGVPSVNDRSLKIVSTLSPETALKGNTELLYIDIERNHELPEVYNGLGFKNLIYMAIQAKHFHSQWLRTPVNRPLCHIVFIEEPEVHLHAQVQQTFISSIWDIIEASALAEGEDSLVSQLVVTTHSSHILDATEFAKIRYFRRCPLAGDEAVGVLNATEIHSLRDFQPSEVGVDGQTATGEEALEFLERYLRLTHCDLFFADAAILVEGASEKLLIPEIISKSGSRLRSSYLTVLEIGGAYAHRFDELLSFLKIPYLIITDLDSVDPTGRHPARRGDFPGALTSNASLKELLEVTTIDELLNLTSNHKEDVAKDRYVTFQQPVLVEENESQLAMTPRTLEEAIAYQNFSLLRTGHINLGKTIPQPLEDAFEAIFKRVGSKGFKKTDFAMSLLARNVEWQTPVYISEGLNWLEERLHGPAGE